MHDGDTVPFETVDGKLERPQARTMSIRLASATPPKLAKMLLPGERITFGTAVHPIVMVLPLFYLIVLPLAFSGLQWYGRMHAHLWFAEGVWPKVETGVELVLLAASLGLLVKRAFRFLSLRIVATNRRIFAIRGVIIRRITPLGNTALAGSTLSQGVLRPHVRLLVRVDLSRWPTARPTVFAICARRCRSIANFKPWRTASTAMTGSPPSAKPIIP